MYVVGGRPPGQQPARSSSGEVPDGGREGRNEELAGLLNRCARGHEDAFAQLYDLTAPRVHGLVLRVLRAPDLAVEVTQEVYISIWRQASRFDRDRGTAMAWIAALAHRHAVDRVRSVSAERNRDTRWNRLQDHQLEEQGGKPNHDQVWEQVDADLDAERVRRALDQLTEVQREALSLAYFGGYSQSEVAALLSIPLGTVKTRIRDGLIRLRDALGVDHTTARDTAARETPIRGRGGQR